MLPSSISIFGCSWGVHSWVAQPDMQETKGNHTFEKLFDCDITNLSKQGASNTKIIEYMEQHIDTVSLSDLTIVFQTDPTRCLLQIPHLEMKYDAVPDHIDYNDMIDKLLLRFYNSLWNVQKKSHTPILLVGGLSMLNPKLIPNGIMYMDKSWTELCIENFKDNYFENTDLTLYTYMNTRTKKDSILKYELIETSVEHKQQAWRDSVNFAHCHPSDSGYIVMYNALKDKIKEMA